MASLVLLNVPQTLVDQIKDWAQQRRLTTDEAAINLLKMAVNSTLPTQLRYPEPKKEAGN